LKDEWRGQEKRRGKQMTNAAITADDLKELDAS